MKLKRFMCRVAVVILMISAVGCAPSPAPTSQQDAPSVTYKGAPYSVVDNNVPAFDDSELTTTSYESYAPLDSLGRCGIAVASIGRDIMPTEERGAIGQVKPSAGTLSSMTVLTENICTTAVTLSVFSFRAKMQTKKI